MAIPAPAVYFDLHRNTPYIMQSRWNAQLFPVQHRGKIMMCYHQAATYSRKTSGVGNVKNQLEVVNEETMGDTHRAIPLARSEPGQI